MYEFDPYTHEDSDILGENKKELLDKYCVGVEGCAWTEHMKIPQDVEYRIFPRILALAETAWKNNDNKKDFN